MDVFLFFLYFFCQGDYHIEYMISTVIEEKGILIMVSFFGLFGITSGSTAIEKCLSISICQSTSVERLVHFVALVRGFIEVGNNNQLIVG